MRFSYLMIEYDSTDVIDRTVNTLHSEMSGGRMRNMKWLGILGVVVGAGCAASDDTTDTSAQATQSPPMTVSAAVQHDISQPLRDAPVDHAPKQRKEHPIG